MNINTVSELLTSIKKKYPKLFITEIIDNDIKFEPEQNDGYIEYKRTLNDCSQKRAEKYATQMRWRICENTKNQCATYFIGVDDDGSIVGLTDKEIMDCITRFFGIAASISASITGIQIIHVNDISIIKIGVKIKKIKTSYIVDFGEKF